MSDYDSLTIDLIGASREGKPTFVEELQAEIRRAATAVLDEERKDGDAVITAKIRIGKAGEDSIVIRCDTIDTKVPALRRRSILCVRTGDGDVVTNAHRQGELFTTHENVERFDA